MGKIEQFEEMEVWQKARRLTTRIYGLSRTGEFAKDFGLRDQIQRAAVSVMSNIAEGFERRSDKSFQQFLSIANGSVGEVRCQLYVALDLGYISNGAFDECQREAIQTGRMITGLLQYLRSSSRS